MKCQDQEFQIDVSVAAFLKSMLKNPTPTTVLDPQKGEAHLLEVFQYSELKKLGIEVEARYQNSGGWGLTNVSGTTVHAFEEIKELHSAFLTKKKQTHNLRIECMVAYPPARHNWLIRDCFVGIDHVADVKMSALEFTFMLGLQYTNYGYVIGDAEELKSTKLLTKYKKNITRTFEIPQYNNELVAVFYESDTQEPITDRWVVSDFWGVIRDVVQEGKCKPYQIEQDRKGCINVHISEKQKYLKSYAFTEEAKINKIRGIYPDTFAIDRVGREDMKNVLALVDSGRFTIDPSTRENMEKSIKDAGMLATPLMPPTDFELCAYIDEQPKIKCHTSGLGFTAGKEYAVIQKLFQFEDSFTRNKVHYSEKDKETYMMEHDCLLIGKDRMIILENDNFIRHRFMDRPNKNSSSDHSEEELWKYFDKPAVNDLAVQEKEAYDRNLRALDTHAMLAGFNYFPGQKDYIARIAVRDFGLPAAETGTGKTLIALSLAVLKSAKRALIIAPQGTTRGDNKTISQWQSEVEKFAPYFQIHEIFSWKDVEKLKKANDGELPLGIYLTYYEAFFYAGTTASGRAIVNAGDNLRDDTIMQICYPNREVTPAMKTTKDFVRSIGEERNGIRSVATPNMSMLVGDEFDLVCMDEAHKMSNLDSILTNMAIRLQPKYRYALTATPIPNHVGNIFPLMGWLCVPAWYKGGRSNAAWPFTRDESSKFNSTFLSVERDLTEERLRRQKDPMWRGKCVKTSPILSRPTSLLKLLKPTLAYITKAACNPDYVAPEVIDIRVPMGVEQSKLYAHYMDRGNINQKSSMARAAVQSAYLRNICCDPATCEQNGDPNNPKPPYVSSNFNPKVVSILELVSEMLARKEQVVVVSSRKGLTQEIANRLELAKIPYSRIDSTVSTKTHTFESKKFKDNKTAVMLMGIKCAEGHSYDNCKNLIISSLEYSYGSFNQAQGRVDRLLSKGAKIYCILHKASIEEVMFDNVATKGDSAAICLKGERIPRLWKPADISEILADSITAFDGAVTEDETTCEAKWSILQKKLELGYRS